MVASRTGPPRGSGVGGSAGLRADTAAVVGRSNYSCRFITSSLVGNCFRDIGVQGGEVGGGGVGRRDWSIYLDLIAL